MPFVHSSKIKCTTCGDTNCKFLVFTVRGQNRIKAQCRPCVNDYHMDYYYKHRKRKLELSKEWAQRNRNKINKKTREWRVKKRMEL